eukprot:IDg13852t1
MIKPAVYTLMGVSTSGSRGQRLGIGSADDVMQAPQAMMRDGDIVLKMQYGRDYTPNIRRLVAVEDMCWTAGTGLHHNAYKVSTKVGACRATYHLHRSAGLCYLQLYVSQNVKFSSR